MILFVRKKKILNHLLYMIDIMNYEIQDKNKWNRWLGFIQGCLFVMKIKTIDDLKSDNVKGLEHALSESKKAIKRKLSETDRMI